ncbi:MAG: hypothetical protein AB7O04_02680 [Hyphomonadaceae bacterium]
MADTLDTISTPSRAERKAPAPSELAAKPELILSTLSTNEMYTIPLKAQCDIHLGAAAMRFKTLVDRLPILRRLAEEQGLTEIRTLEDLGTLLIPHSAMKSYPISYLDESRFDRLTKWLSGFTTHDLSKVDVNACETIDDWIDALDAQTKVRIAHSTGTSGKLSFLPRGVDEMPLKAPGYTLWFDPFGDEKSLLDVPVNEAPILYLQYRKGAYAQMRLLDVLEEHLYKGDASMILTINPGRFSSEAVSLAGRLRAAEAKGELGKVSLVPKLMARRDAFVKEQASAEEHLNNFLDETAVRFRGKSIAMMGHLPQLFRVANAAIARGYTDMFSPGSFVAGGGGLKGASLPDDWQNTVGRWLGQARPVLGYGMTEQIAAVRICPGGHYHIPPWQIPFVLDPQTGEQFPRRGTQTGRFGVYDLNASSYWGGFLTGDRVTLSYGDDEPCSCGRIGPYLHDSIRRYTEAEGGDDKITCAGAPQAYDKALDYIVQMGG